MNIKEYRELYEGLTQEDSSFRDELGKLGVQADRPDDLELAKNRLNYAMLGVHPIYRREVELSGMVDYDKRTLSLYADDGDVVLPFNELDPKYVNFLEDQRGMYEMTKPLPFSSIALKASNEMLKDEMEVPDISDVVMNVPEKLSEGTSISRDVLQKAFTRSMVMMNHLQEQIQKHGIDKVYGANKDQLVTYVNSNAFDMSFEKSVHQLDDIADKAVELGRG